MPAIHQVREGEPNEEKGEEGRQEGPEKREIRPANKIRNYRTPRLHRGARFLWPKDSRENWLKSWRRLLAFPTRLRANREKAAARRRRPPSAAPKRAARAAVPQAGALLCERIPG